MTDDPDLYACIPVWFRNGMWVDEDGRPLTAAPGTRAEVWLHRDQLGKLWPLEARAIPECGQFLGPGARLRFSLAVRQPAELKGTLLGHLIPPQDMREMVEWVYVKGRFSTEVHFIEIELGEPTDDQRDKFPDFEGGLLVKVYGERIDRIEASKFALPEGVGSRRPQSLNEAFTILSETYELHRTSHTGNIYDRVFYMGADKRWYPLETLRQIGVARSLGDPMDTEETAEEFWSSGTWWEVT